MPSYTRTLQQLVTVVILPHGLEIELYVLRGDQSNQTKHLHSVQEWGAHYTDSHV